MPTPKRSGEMIPNRVEKREYHIAFDNRPTPGFIRAVKITIEADMLPDDSAAPEREQAKYEITLCDHPLYPELRRYCLANPPGGSPRRK